MGYDSLRRLQMCDLLGCYSRKRSHTSEENQRLRKSKTIPCSTNAFKIKPKGLRKGQLNKRDTGKMEGHSKKQLIGIKQTW